MQWLTGEYDPLQEMSKNPRAFFQFCNQLVNNLKSVPFASFVTREDCVTWFYEKVMKESVDMSDIQTSEKKVLFIADHVMRDFSECFAVPCLDKQSSPNHAHGGSEGCDLFIIKPSIQTKVKNLKKRKENIKCVLQEIKTYVQEKLEDEELKLVLMEKDHDTGFVYNSVNRRRFDLVDCEEILCKVGIILQRTWGTRSVNRPKPSLSTCNPTVREDILPKQTS